MCGKRLYPFTNEMNALLKELFPDKLDKDIAAKTGWSIYMISYQAKKLGLKKKKRGERTTGKWAAYIWTADQEQYLRDNYRKMGDSDMAETLQHLFPREIPLKAHNIKKKRLYLQLERTAEEALAIASAHGKAGGRAHTILQNSGGLTLSDGFIAGTMTRDADLREALKQYPELLNVKRQQLLLNRQIKEATT